MVALQRIQVKGFKSIREMDLELRPLNVLIGANGAGKSNFLSVFSLLSQIARKSLDFYVPKLGGPDTLLHFGKKTTQSLEIQLYFGDDNVYETKLVPSLNDRLLMSDETIQSHSVEAIRELLSDFRLYHFDDTTDTAKIKSAAKVEDNRFLRPDGENLAAYLYLLRERYRQFYDRIVETIQLVAPFFDDFILQPRKLKPDSILLEWREKGSDAYFDANMLSDGTLRFMCLATLLRQPNPPPLILIDEPELGLHPYAITLLAAMLKSAAVETQIIITTQSPTLVDHFNSEDIVVVDRRKDENSFQRLNSDELKDWLEDYSLGELWQKNIVGGRP